MEAKPDWIERWRDSSIGWDSQTMGRFDVMDLAQTEVSSVEVVLRTLCGGTRLMDPLWHDGRAMAARQMYMRIQRFWQEANRRNGWGLGVAYWSDLGHMPVRVEEEAMAMGKSPGIVLGQRSHALGRTLALVADARERMVGKVRGKSTLNRVAHLLVQEAEGLERWVNGHS